MKKNNFLKKIMIMLLCMVLVQGPVEFISQPVTVQAATLRNGKIGDYYYKNGRILKNLLINWKGQYYYFGSNGKCYKAPKVNGMAYNIATKKINNRYYGFDSRGRRLSGVTASKDGKFYYFDKKTGVYHSYMTNKLRAASTYKKDATTLRKLLGAPRYTKSESSCFGPGKDLTLVYDYVLVYIFRSSVTGKEIVLGVQAR